jgi:hypothetical protein
MLAIFTLIFISDITTIPGAKASYFPCAGKGALDAITARAVEAIFYSLLNTPRR